MSQVPARLVYTDSNDDEQVIGSFLPQDVTEGSISTFTIDEDAGDYKRVIIEGEPQLQQRMPTTLNEFGTPEPEIRVEIDENGDGNWSQRIRVYPEKAGTTDERGRYKNKNLWGFKKYYGEDDVEVTSSTNGPITTNIADAVDALLPSGYTSVYPGDITPPSVSNYTFRGARQQAFKEIQEDYDHFIIFTDETDGNGDIEVRVEPTGYGGVATSITRGQDTLHYDYWEKNDLSNIISKVRIIGTDSNGDTVDETFEAGTGDLNDLPDPDKNRFKLIHIDYTINSNDAEEIARGIINPTGTEHGAIESDLRPQSTLNESIGVLDDSREIDDVFTVVKQKDYLHQGITYYSFEFERESTKEERDKWREHDNERAKIYSGVEEEESLDTGDALSDTEQEGEVKDDESDTDVDGSVQSNESDTDIGGQVQQHGEANVEVVDQVSTSFTESIGNSDEFIAGVSGLTMDATYHLVGFQLDDNTDNKALKLGITSSPPGLANSFVQFVDRMDNVSSSFIDIGDASGNVAWQNEITLAVDADQLTEAGDTYSLRGVGSGATSTTVSGVFYAVAVTHDHPDTFITTDNLHGHLDDFITVDDLHGGGTGDDQHGASGLIEKLKENRTDRD